MSRRSDESAGATSAGREAPTRPAAVPASVSTEMSEGSEATPATEPLVDGRRPANADLARVTLIGRLGADPERRSTDDGRPRVRFRVAVNQRRRGPGDDWQERADWYSVTAFGPLADRASERLSRGLRVFVQGRLESRVWDGPEGQRTFLDVVADDVIPLERLDGARRSTETGPEEALAELEDLPF